MESETKEVLLVSKKEFISAIKIGLRGMKSGGLATFYQMKTVYCTNPSNDADREIWKIYIHNLRGRKFRAYVFILCVQKGVKTQQISYPVEIWNTQREFIEFLERECDKAQMSNPGEDQRGATEIAKSTTEKEFYVHYTSDNEPSAQQEVRSMLDGLKGCEVIDMSTIDSKRACRNAYGKKLDEKEFEAIEPESEEAWFDDYDFVFKVIIMMPTELCEKEINNLLRNVGLNIHDKIEE